MRVASCVREALGAMVIFRRSVALVTVLPPGIAGKGAKLTKLRMFLLVPFESTFMNVCVQLLPVGEFWSAQVSPPAAPMTTVRATSNVSVCKRVKVDGHVF